MMYTQLLEKALDKHIYSIISNHFPGNPCIVFHGMDFNKNELSISFKRYRNWSMGDYDRIFFSKEYNNLYIVKTETYLCKYEIFKKIFVNIENCPNRMKEQLYETRKKQIYEI